MSSPLLSDLTMHREREKMRSAAIDLLVDQALGRPIDLTGSGYAAHFAKAGITGVPALVNPWSVFVQDRLRPLTALGQMARWTWPAEPGAPVVALGASPVGNFVVQGQPIPVVALPIEQTIAEVSKLALAVAFDRRVFERAPRAAIETALAQAIAQSEDLRLLDDVPAVSGARPAGLRSGAPVFAAAGASAAEVGTAFAAALASVVGPNKVAIATEETLGYLGSLGTFPEARTDGTGTLGGVPIIVARAGPAGLVVLQAAGALAVYDGGVTIETASDGAIDFSATPAMPPTALVSLWQSNAIAVKTVRLVWWWRATDSAAVLDLGLAAGS